MHLGERRHLHGIVGDERGLDERALAGLAENLVDELALARCLVHGLNLQLVDGYVAYLLLAQAVEVVACLLLDGVEDGQAPEWGLVADGLCHFVLSFFRNHQIYPNYCIQ